VGRKASKASLLLSRFHLHLVSDSTGDTVHSVARACLVQFDGSQAIEHVWSMVRTRSQIDRVIAGIEANRGLVLFTLVNDMLRQALQEGCRQMQVQAIPVLDPVIGALASYLGSQSRGMPGKQHLTMTGSRAGASTMPMSASSEYRGPRKRRLASTWPIAGSRQRMCPLSRACRCRLNC
jgi:hypothetical protein